MGHAKAGPYLNWHVVIEHAPCAHISHEWSGNESNRTIANVHGERLKASAGLREIYVEKGEQHSHQGNNDQAESNVHAWPK